MQGTESTSTDTIAFVVILVAMLGGWLLWKYLSNRKGPPSGGTGSGGGGGDRPPDRGGPIRPQAFAALAAVLAVLAVEACTRAEAKGPPDPSTVVAILLQQTDSARVVFRWTPKVVERNQFPVVAWDTRLVSVAGDTLARGSTTATRDTLAVEWPALPDSIQLTAQVRGVDSRDSTGLWGVSNIVTVKLTPTAPSAPDVQIDSIGGQPQASAAVVAPDTLWVALHASGTVCAFKVFASGHVALRSPDRAACDSLYVATFDASERAVTQAEQDWEDQQCWTWTSAQPLVVSVAPQGSCAAAATVTGLQLTAAPVQPDAVRYASLGARPLGPVATVDDNGLVTCHRPGLARIEATVEGRRGSALIECRSPYGVLAARD